MAKRPENMDCVERLRRIHVLERERAELSSQLRWVEDQRQHALLWGQDAHKRNRRLCDIIDKLVEKVGPLKMDTMAGIQATSELRNHQDGSTNGN